ncbi:MAG: hypothetical protein DI537_08740 [Stutzerimonas stutzeri]|nr:MAG: hypothetical protein DI537_08740 [Stutzerimonas stutzeri]
MSDLTVRTDIDLNGLDRLLLLAAERAPSRIARALNRTGSPTQTAYLRTVRKVLGLRSHPYAKRPIGNVIRRRTSTKKASGGRLVYSLAGFGGGLPAIHYQPKEAPAGASINWLGARRTIGRSFYLGGKFPRRKRSKISHVVWRRIGAGKWALDRPEGPGVPEAMAQAAPRTVWEGEAGRRLPKELQTIIGDLLRGY